LAAQAQLLRRSLFGAAAIPQRLFDELAFEALDGGG
jgi:hypothetical protein